jgi:hypothetical protein
VRLEQQDGEQAALEHRRRPEAAGDVEDVLDGSWPGARGAACRTAARSSGTVSP